MNLWKARDVGKMFCYVEVNPRHWGLGVNISFGAWWVVSISIGPVEFGLHKSY